MISNETCRELALRLDEAERTRVQIPLISAQYPDMTLDDGYAVQRAWTAHKCAQYGRVPVGRKIGLTSRAMQRASNINEPDYGLLLDDMVFDECSNIPMARFIEPRVEVELAFMLKRPLEGDAVTLYDVLNATDYVVPALEIIDARVQRIDPDTKRTRTAVDTIADNAANAGVVLGGRPIRPDAIDLRWVRALLYRNGIIEESGVAAAVLNHPARGVAWLASRLAAHGERLEPGQIILSGSFTAPVFANPGDSFHVDYNTLGSIAVRFV